MTFSSLLIRSQLTAHWWIRVSSELFMTGGDMSSQKTWDEMNRGEVHDLFENLLEECGPIDEIEERLAEIEVPEPAIAEHRLANGDMIRFIQVRSPWPEPRVRLPGFITLSAIYSSK